MTEFERWRLARQEADRLLQQLKDFSSAEPAPPEHPRSELQRAGRVAAMRAAALRLLRPGPR